MQITWIKCSELMPPGDNPDDYVIRKFMGKINRQAAWIVRVCASVSNGELAPMIEWTPFTREKWNELNK